MKKHLQKITAILLAVTMMVSSSVSPLLASETYDVREISPESYGTAVDDSAGEDLIIVGEETPETTSAGDSGILPAEDSDLVVESIIVEDVPEAEPAGDSEEAVSVPETAETELLEAETPEPAETEEEPVSESEAENRETEDETGISDSGQTAETLVSDDEPESLAAESESESLEYGQETELLPAETEEESGTEESELFLEGLDEPSLTAETEAFQDGDFGYYVYEDETGNFKAAVSSYTGTAELVTIPATLGGYAVGAIGERAFYDNDTLTGIVLPEGIESIGSYAFYYCGVKSIALPKSLKEVAEYAFDYTDFRYVYYAGSESDWEAIAVESGNSELLNSDNPPYDIFCCESTGWFTYEVPETNIQLLCADGTEIKIVDCNTDAEGELEIPAEINGKKVTEIVDAAFYMCRSLTGITLPDTVTAIGSYAFYRCQNMTKVNIPSGVTKIESYAFYYCDSLEGIVLPEGVESIGSNAFYYCGVKSIALPKSLKEVAEYAFDYTDFRYVYYAGSESDWEAIAVESGNSELLNSDNPPYCILCYESTGALTYEVPDTGITFEYSAGEGENISIIGCSQDISGSLTIPGEINGKRVTRIASGAFDDCDELVKVVLPESIVRIGKSAFYSCDELVSAVFSGGTPYIDNHAFFDCGKLASVDLPNGVSYIGDGAFDGCRDLGTIESLEGVTYIGNYAFRDCEKLASADLPETLESIGEYAFSCCSSLQGIVVPAKVTVINNGVFAGCSSLSDLEILGSVEKIGEWAFSGCAKLTEIPVPASVTDIGSGAFENCSSLKNIELPGNISEIRERLFSGCAKLTEIPVPASVTDIGSSAFENCSSLKSIELPGNISEIRERLFYGCTSLTSVKLPAGIVSVGDCAFYNCGVLSGVELPETVESVGYQAFSLCSSLTEMILPQNVTEISDEAFYNCESLSSVEFRGNLLQIGERAFSSCAKLDGLNLPDSVTSIGRAAFADCASLVNMLLPRKVNEINDGLFSGCTSLQTVDILGEVTSIGYGAFSDCTSLDSVSLPDTVQKIESRAFSGCTFLSYITMPETLGSIGSEAFSNCTSLEQTALPGGITSIPYGLFDGCTNLEILYIPPAVTSIDESLADLEQVVLNVETGSYAEEFAIAHGMQYAIGKPIGGGIVNINIQLDPEYDWDAYEGMTLFVNCGEKRYSQKIVAERSYRFIGLPAYTSCSVSVQNAYGDILAEKNDIAVENKKQTVTLSASVAALGAEVRVLDEKMQDVTGQAGIEWYAEDGTLYASGAALQGIPEGKKLICRTRLDETLGVLYEAPEEKEYTISSENNIFTVQLKPFQKRTVSGSIVNEDGEAVSASIAVIQNLNETYYANQMVITESDGSFSAEIYSPSAKLTVEAYGYMPLEKTVEESDESKDLGQIVLTPVDGSRLALQIEYTEAVPEGQNAVKQTLSQWDDLEFQVDNKTTGETVLDFIRQKESLILTGRESSEDTPEAQVSPGDTLSVTVSSLSGDFAPAKGEAVMDENGNGSASLSLIQYGSVLGSLDGGKNRQVRMSVYGADGKLAWNGQTEEDTLQSGPLPSGTYTVVGMGAGEFLTCPDSLEAMEKTGYVEGKDYKSEQVTIEDGKISALDLGTIPLLEEERFYYTQQENTMFQANKTNTTAGKSFTIRARALWKEEYQDKVSDIRWVFEIPDDCEYVNGTLSADGKPVANAEIKEDRITVPVEDVSSLIRLCLIAVKEGTYHIDGFLQFTLDGKEILQPVGTAEVKVGELSFQICDKTNNTIVSASGTAPAFADIQIYDNDTLAAVTSANSQGVWSSDFELYKPYTYSTHRIYASVVTREGVKLRTGTKEVLYQYSLSPVSVKQVNMGMRLGHGPEKIFVFRFDGKKQAESVSYSYNPSYPAFSFQIVFNGEDLSTVSNVQLDVLCSDGKTKTLYPVKNERDGTWVTSENFYFSSLPVNVSVRYDYDAGFVVSREQQADETAKWEEWMEGFDGIDVLWEHLETDIDVEIDEEMINEGAISQEEYDALLQEEERLRKELDDYNTALDSAKQSFDDLLEAVGRMGEVTEATADGIKVSTPAGDLNITKDPDMSAKSLEDQGYVGVPSKSGEPGYYYNPDPQNPSGADPTSGVRIDVIPNPALNSGIDAETAASIWDEWGLDDTMSAARFALGTLGTCVDAIDQKKTERLRDELKQSAGIKQKYAKIWGERAADVEHQYPEYAQRLRNRQQQYISEAEKELARAEKLAKKASAVWKLPKVVGAAGIFAQGFSACQFWKDNIAIIDRISQSSDSAEVQAFCKHLRSKLIGYMIYKAGATVADIALLFATAGISISITMLQFIGETVFENYFESEIRKLERMAGKARTEYAQKSRENNYIPIVDPSGYVYEAVPRNRLAGVIASCYEKVTKYDQYEEAHEEIEFWNASEYGQQNPLITDAQGQYAWDVPDGKWQVKYEKEGYETAYSEWMDVPPPRFDVNVGLVSYEPPVVTRVQATPKSVEITFSKYMRGSSLTDSCVEVLLDGRKLEGSVELLDGEENPEKAGELLASRIRFIPTEERSEGEELTVTVANKACSYVGVRMERKSVNTAEVMILPETLEADSQVALSFNGAGVISVQALPVSAAAGKKLVVEDSESMIFGVEQTSLTLDENAKAELPVQALMPGEGEVTFRLEGTDLTAHTRIAVSLPAAEVPAASAVSGEVEKGTAVTLSCGTENAVVYYTLDGSDPASSDTVQKYTGTPIILEESCVLQAMAVREGMLDSETVRYEYTVIAQASGCEAGNHTWIWVTDAEATCGAPGSRHQECSVCHIKGEEEVIPATGAHTMQTVVDKAATCGEAGSQHQECSVCGTRGETTVIPATGAHTMQTVVDKAATCGTLGSQHQECTVCGTEGETTVIPATGAHTMQTVIDKAATCGTTGSSHQECTVCGTKGETTVIPATGAHTMQTVVDKAATCGTSGSQHQECTVCGYKENAVEVPASGQHTWGDYDVTRRPTAVREGSETRTCSVCGASETRTVEKLPATLKLTVNKLPLQVKKSVNLKQIVTNLAEGDSIRSWKSSKPKIAAVNKAGKVTGKKAGKAKITVTLASGKSASLTVTVQKKEVQTSKIGNVPKTLKIKKGRKVSLAPVLTPISSLQKVEYKTSKKSVAVVSKKGVITAKAKGKAKITVISGKKKVTVTVTVTK